MIHIGIDPSMSSTAICVLNSTQAHFYGFGTQKWVGEHDCVTVYLKPEKEDCHDFVYKRAMYTAEIVTIATRKAHHTFNDGNVSVAMEGYSYGSAKGKAFEIGEFCGHVKSAIYDFGHDITILPPKSIKKFATGSGNADKTLMERVMQEKYPDIYAKIAMLPRHPREDMIDAFWIAKNLECINNSNNNNLEK